MYLSVVIGCPEQLVRLSNGYLVELADRIAKLECFGTVREGVAS
jgi:hypothetical protein